jgi:ATP-binding cassette subfamily B protein
MMEDQELYSAEHFDLESWKRILKIIVKDKKSLVLMLLAVIVMTCIDIGYPLLNKYALETFFSETPNFDSVPFFIILYSLIALSMGVSVWAFIRAAAKVVERTTFEIRMQAFKNLQQLSFSYFDNTPTGWVMARMTSDARRLANIISWGLVDFLWGFLLMIGILIISFFINWRLALIMTALLPIFIVIAILYRKKILKEHREVRKINSHITASYNESFMAANTTKTLVLEDDNAQEFNDLAEKYKRRAIRAAFFSSLFWPTILFLGYIGVAIVTYVGGKMVLNDPLGILFTTGTLYLFVDYAIKFFDPVMIVARVLTDLQQAQASAERVISLIETPSDIVDTPEVVEKYGTLFEHKKENWEPIEGAITFDNVSFRYKNTDNNVLTNFNLEIKAGQMVAFVGETGSGKSTIVNLISRFYEPTEGRILIDGKDYRERSISWLHANLGYVLQTPQLFSTTIKENIRYGKLDATDEEVIAAAKLANAHNFILEQENGYDTYIGEGGNKLSTGQKQLISFARAVIANPRILVLDEATSSIDTENEKTILEAMQTVLKGRTSLVVAHRLSTIVNADKIVVLRNGVVVEEGTHRELLNAKGYYFELYRNQFMQELEQKLIQDI